MKSRKNNKPFNLGAVYAPTTNVLFGRVVTVLLLSCFGAVAQASLITVNWSGTVTSSEILRVIDTGDTVTGSYT